MGAAQLLLAALSGGVVALFLTVLGGGGSAPAAPLLLYVVGVSAGAAVGLPSRTAWAPTLPWVVASSLA